MPLQSHCAGKSLDDHFRDLDFDANAVLVLAVNLYFAVQTFHAAFDISQPNSLSAGLDHSGAVIACLLYTSDAADEL